MNSLEEKALFEANGWEKNYVTGEWVAPGGNIIITSKDLMEYTTTREGEETLKQVVRGYGHVQR